MSNPLLEENALPAFDRIRPEHVVPAVEQTLARIRSRLQELLSASGNYSWETLLSPLEQELECLHRVWSPVAHLNSVVNSDELRAAYNQCLPKLSEFETELGQHEGLFRAVKTIAGQESFHELSQAQRKSIENRLRDFRLSGIELETDKRTRLKEIQQQLSELQSKFHENLLDATNAWNKPVASEAQLAGLPASAMALMAQTARQKNLDGWLLTLEFPSYFPVITYADDRALREELYTAYVTRASDTGPHDRRWDNSAVMEDILRLRHEKAQLLGFANYAELSLETKMAATTSEVVAFLNDLAQRSRDKAIQDLEEVTAFAAEQGAGHALEAWDIPYYSEKLRQHRYALSQEELKPYFPDNRVLEGMFGVVGKLFGVTVHERNDVPRWHEDVRFFEILDSRGKLRGQFYLDLYARPNKRGGAWMDDCHSRMRVGEHLQVPVAYLTCNFSPPIGDQPALLTHDEVITMFHEFGHGLHHMLTQVEYPSVAGINGVAWDAVELPSQFMENWCWEREALTLISGHYQTGEAIPDDLFARMKAARNFQSAMQMVRQLEFALFDMSIHLEYDPLKGGRIYPILESVRRQVAVVTPPPFNRFPHSFSHIFGGGYAAGYYSYKWAEVLSADAFSVFEENGIFDSDSGRRFLQEILEQGGSRDPMDLFVAFRGRKPSTDALLRHSGLAA